MNKKGFTLIELIAVIVIMGMLLMIVLPATGRIMATNDKREYDEYYKLVKYAALKYARGRANDLGGVSASGCTEKTGNGTSGITIDTLVNEGLLKKFEKSGENVECFTPSTLKYAPGVGSAQNAKAMLDNRDPGDFYDIRIVNKKGTITVYHSMVCVRNGRVTYKKLVEKDGSACVAYEPASSDDLYKSLLTSGKLESAVNGVRFIKSDNNYIKYSGRLWRIVSVNENNKTVKAVLNDVATYINYDETTSSAYKNSNAETWIASTFRETLNNPTVFLFTNKWNYGSVANGNAPATDSASTTFQNSIGLLDLYEFTKTKTYIPSPNNVEYFLLSQKDDTNVWYVKGDNTAATTGANTFKGVRPVIVFRPGVAYNRGGNGKADNPYEIIGEKIGVSGELLKTRYVGEYVNFSGKAFRIISISDDGIKIMSTAYSLSSQFDNTNIYKFSTGALIGISERTGFYNGLSNTNKSLIKRVDYCTSKYINTTKYVKTCASRDKRAEDFTIPTIGEMYTVPYGTDSYWTTSVEIERDTDPTVQLMTSSGPVGTNIRGSGKIYPVVLLRPTVKISGTDGNGTASKPYGLSL